MAIDSIDFNTASSGLTITVTPVNPLVAPIGAVNYELAAVLNNLASSNINISVNTISSTNTDGNIILAPNGTGSIILGNQAMNPPTLDSMANLFNLNSLTAGNLHLEGNTLSSTDTNGNIFLTPNGTGNVIIGNNIINPITINSTGDLYNLRSITVNNVYAINTTTNTLKAFTSIETPQLTAGNLRIIDNTLFAINRDGSINLLANGEGVVICRAHFDGNNNNFQNINSLTAGTINATSININSDTVSSPIFRGWVVYDPTADNILKSLNATIDRNGAGNYTVSWEVPPPDASYGINVTTGIDSNGNANYANITNQDRYSFNIIISTNLDAFVYCTMFY